MNPFRRMTGYGNLPSIPQNNAPNQLDPRLVSSSVAETMEQQYRYGGLVTYEKPIVEFPADITIPVNAAGSVTILRSGSELPNNCVGIRFLSLVAGVTISINGGGQRLVQNGDTLSGVEISSLIVYTDATGTCVVQSVGTGD